MKAGRFNGHRIISPQRQRGVVLLIALIILVAMTLAGIGMMRSVDTGNLVAGNLSFRQATMNASDAGIVEAFNQLLLRANSADINAVNKTLLNFNNGQPCPAGATASGCPGGTISFPGYSSTPISPCEVTGQVAGQVDGVNCTSAQNNWWTVNANWANAVTLPAVTDPTNGAVIATVSYVIHRMCKLPNAEQTAQSTVLATGTQLCQTEKDYRPKSLGAFTTIFRITTRSVGTRNTVTYTQALAKIDMQ